MLIDGLKVTADTLLGTTSARRSTTGLRPTWRRRCRSARIRSQASRTASLVKDTDYTVAGNTVTIKQAYLAQQPEGTANLSFAFAGGDTQTLAVMIVVPEVRNSTINPNAAGFDLKVTKQADVTTTLTLNDNTFVGIDNDGTALVEGTDYALNGNVLTIKKPYLAKQAVGAVPLTLTFSAGNPQTLTITVTDTSSEGRYANINNDDPAIHYDGSWNRSTGRGMGDYMDDVQFAEKNGESFSYTFRGTGIKVITEMDESQGEMDVYVDGVFKATVDTRHNGRLAQQTVYEIGGLSNSEHTIKAVKKSGGYMLLDMLKVRIPDLIGPSAAIRSCCCRA